VRAQVGSSAAVGGTLACMIDQGLDSAYLAARFAELFGIEPSSLSALVRGGYYRFTSAFPASVV